MSSVARQYTDYLKGPYENAVAVTPSDSAQITDSNGNPVVASNLWIGVSAPGNLKVTLYGGSTVTFANPPVGWLSQVGLRITHVWSTGTTVTTMIAVW